MGWRRAEDARAAAKVDESLPDIVATYGGHR
jgi:hypothetical protein